jgi:uncharacterized Tic20 family protein
MTDRIPAKFRYLAAIHHLIFAIVTFPIAVGIPLSNIFRNTPGIANLLGLSFELLILFLIFVIPIFYWLLWILTRKIHPFIDLAGRDVRNYTINHSLVCLLIIFITFTTCGIKAPNSLSSSRDSKTAGNILNGAMIVLYCNEAGYFINSVTSAIFNIRGYRFKNRLLIPFIKDN